jgi:crotonobetainyl-CoA:carnitine CoA-transferase CaiB-like acyl-CoA transferase
LEGIRVVAIEHAVAAPICTRHLADLGADVIKVERPGGGDFARNYDSYVLGQASFFVWLNRGKRSLTLDVKHKQAKDVLNRLIGGADVLIQNLAPGAAARLGLSYEALQPTNKNLIVADISGYGDAGPFAQKKAYDLLIQAESGLMSVTGTADTPSRVGISAADIATGMYALTGIQAALLRRFRFGEGANIKVAMLDALTEWMMYPIYRHAYDGSVVPREPSSHPALAPYGAHAVQDGRVIFGLQNEREWVTFCARVLGQPEVATDPRFNSNAQRRDHREALTRLIEDFFADKTAMQVVALLDAAGIANGRMNTAKDVYEHVQFVARDRWREVNTQGGKVRALLPPMTFTDHEAVMGDVPALGQHTDAVLGELGFAAAEIAALHTEGAV